MACASMNWWRQRYLVDAGSIQPVRRARADRSQHGNPGEWYDPFASYFRRDDWEESSPLHLALAGLDTDDEEQIERFCSNWGLLGLFQHSLIQVTYVPGERGGATPRHNPPHSYPEVVETPWGRTERPPQDPVSRERFFYRRLAGQCDTAPELTEAWAKSLTAGELEEWWSQRECGGEAIVLQVGGLVALPIFDWFGRFFRDLDYHLVENALGEHPRGLHMLPEYPTWSSPWLWEALSEPVAEFRAAAAEFGATFQLCATLEAGPDEGGELAQAIVGRINRHLVLARTQFGPGSDGESKPSINPWRQHWGCPSLLAAGYLMLGLSLARGVRFRYCSNRRCSKPFEAERADQLFCSRACQRAEKQRRLRERHGS